MSLTTRHSYKTAVMYSLNSDMRPIFGSRCLHYCLKQGSVVRSAAQQVPFTVMSRKISTVLIDLSGTIHIGDKEIPGSIQSLEKLRKANLNIKFVTNTSKETHASLLNRLNRIGFNVESTEVFSALTAAKRLIEKRQLRPYLLIDDKAMEDFDGVDKENPNAVVVGLAPDKFDYSRLNEAFRLLMDGAEFISINESRYFRREDGLALGAGPFVNALKHATGREASVIGKPNQEFFLSSIEEFQTELRDCIMIGDDALDDIQAAQKHGMLGILVQTGKYREGDEDKVQPAPHHVCQNFAAAVDYILNYLVDV